MYVCHEKWYSLIDECRCSLYSATPKRIYFLFGRYYMSLSLRLLRAYLPLYLYIIVWLYIYIIFAWVVSFPFYRRYGRRTFMQQNLKKGDGGLNGIELILKIKPFEVARLLYVKLEVHTRHMEIPKFCMFSLLLRIGCIDIIAQPITN